MSCEHCTCVCVGCADCGEPRPQNKGLKIRRIAADPNQVELCEKVKQELEREIARDYFRKLIGLNEQGE